MEPAFRARGRLGGSSFREILCGGSGDTVVTTLDGFDVYAALIPEDAEWFNLAVESGGVILSNSQQFLANGEVMYVTSSPDVPVLNATWIAGSGSWSSGANWSMVFDATGLPPTGSEDPMVPGVPSNSAAYAFNIAIDQDVAVDADISVAVDQVNIGADDRVTVLAGQALTIERFAVRTDSGKINNDGEIFLDGSAGSTSRLFVSGPGLMLDGAGVLRTTATSDNVIAGLRDGDSLTQFADHSIEAAGALGNNRTAISNYGRIESIGELTIDPAGAADRTSAAMTNHGVIEVDGANTLRLVDGFFHNAAGGLIESKFVDRIEVADARLVNDGDIVLNINSRLVFSGLAMLSGNDIETDPYSTQIDVTDAMMINQTKLVGVTTIDNSVINNTGGQFGGYAATQDDWSTTTITGSSIIGGALDGYVSADGSSFRDITFLPDAKLNGGHIGLVGVIDNQMGAPSGTDSGFGVVDRIDLLGDTTLTGSGFASGVFEATEIHEVGSVASLTLMPEVTLVTTHLEGNLYVDNQGVLEAPEGTGELILRVEELRNRGVIRAGDLTTLHFSTSVLDNAGGVIDSSSTTLEFARLTGGVLRSDVLLIVSDAEIQGTQLLTTAGGSGTLTIALDPLAELTLRDVSLGARTVFNGAEDDESLKFLSGVEFNDDGILELARLQAKFVEDVQFQGTGTLFIDGASLGAAESVSPRLTFGEQFTVEGIADESVNLGTDSLYLENHGTITGLDLLVDPIGDADDAQPGLVNRGAIVGDVHIEHARIDNTDGVIGNGVTLAGVNVRGGTLADVHFTLETIDPDREDGLFPNRLEDVTLEGPITIEEELILAGAIENNTTLEFDDFISFLPDGAARLTGTGVMEFYSGLFLAGASPGDTLTNEAGHTLDFYNSPETDFDFGDVQFVNNGTVKFYSANLLTSLTSQTLPAGTVVPDLSDRENPDAVMTLTEETTYTAVAPFTNNGALEAEILHLTDNVIRNTGDLVVFELYLDDSSVLNHDGALGAGPGRNVYLNGASYLSGGAANDLTIVVSDSLGSGPGGIDSMNLDGTTLSATSPVQLAGEVGKIAQLEINNLAGVATVLVEDEFAVIEVANTDVVAGKLRLAAGVYRTDALTSAIPAPLEWTGGRLEVDTFDGNLTQDGGTLAVGVSTRSTHITGDYQQNGGSIELELAGATAGIGYDQVQVDGAATLAGDLELVLLDFAPEPSDAFAVLDAVGGLAGAFSNVASGERLDTVDGVGSFLVHYGAGSAFNQNQIVLTGFLPSFTADFDLDGDVDGDDLVQWRGDFGVNELSDADGDGDSDGADFLAWQRQLGSGSAAPAVSTPEPPASSLLACGLLLLSAAATSHRRRSARPIG